MKKTNLPALVFMVLLLSAVFLTLKGAETRQETRGRAMQPVPSVSPSISPYPDIEIYHAELTGGQEVPANASLAQGQAMLSVNRATGKFDLYVYAKGITLSEITSSHLHAGIPAVAGAAIYDLGKAEAGEYNPSLYWSAFVFQNSPTPWEIIREVRSGTFPAEQLQALQSGNIYVNIHTSDFPGGEIRGQFMPGYFSSLEPEPNPIQIENEFVSLTADDFYIAVNGEKFYLDEASFVLHSDEPTSGDPNYMTLEASWWEKGIQMSLYMYFKKDSQKWWAYEIRTGNGLPIGDWVFFPADIPLSDARSYFETDRSMAYQVPELLLISGTPNKYQSQIYFKNLSLSTFTHETVASPAPSATPIASPALPSEPPLIYPRFQYKLQAINRAAEPKQFEVTFKQNGLVIATQSATASADTTGVYLTELNSLHLLESGTYTVLVKTAGYLTRVFTNLLLSTGSVPYDLTTKVLLSGDVVPDDKVNIFDYSGFVADFGATSQSSADFDADGDVDIFDYSSFVSNFATLGETD